MHEGDESVTFVFYNNCVLIFTIILGFEKKAKSANGKE